MLYAQFQAPSNTMHQRQLLALDIIRHSSMHSKSEDMASCPADGVPASFHGSNEE
jgi:hypothetical protein